jgi:peptidoglycan/LPS O-acetylase OafA/YrhL
MAGAAVWVLMQSEFNTSFRVDVPRYARLVLPVLVIVAIVAAAFEGANTKNSMVVWLSVVFWGLVAAVLTLLLSAISPSGKGVLAPLSMVGRLSFSLYLVHFPIFTGLSKFKEVWAVSLIPFVNFLSYMMLAFGLALPIAWALYKFVELPGIKFGKK